METMKWFFYISGPIMILLGLALLSMFFYGIAIGEGLLYSINLLGVLPLALGIMFIWLGMQEGK